MFAGADERTIAAYPNLTYSMIAELYFVSETLWKSRSRDAKT